MKILIAGSRNLHAVAYVDFIDACLSHWASKNDIIEFITGDAPGIDQYYHHYEDYGEPTKFIPDWDKHGKKAGMIRNAEMAEYCDAAIIIWDGESRGTKNMIDNMHRANKPYILYKVNTNE